VRLQEEKVKVREIMSRHVSVVSPDDTIEKAASMMGDANVGILPVLEGRRLVGIVTDRDIVVRGVAKGTLAKQVGRGRCDDRKRLLLLRG
jgi:CBS domain-containing protein